MPPSADLPPPPAHPQLPPEVRIAGEEEITFTTDDGVDIEALGRFGDSPGAIERAVILCHPHPLYGATMHNALVVVVTRGLSALGSPVAWLRFNYRGVGKSGGAYDKGRAEVRDAQAAIAYVRRRAPGAAISLVGISFGTGVGYSAAVAEADPTIDRIALIAPLPRVMRHDLGAYTGKLQVVSASNDEFCTLEESQAIAAQVGGEFHVIEGADHQFIRYRRQIAALVVPFVAPFPSHEHRTSLPIHRRQDRHPNRVRPRR